MSNKNMNYVVVCDFFNYSCILLHDRYILSPDNKNKKAAMNVMDRIEN